ncbi:S9 family peptidase [soil metagenome]
MTSIIPRTFRFAAWIVLAGPVLASPLASPLASSLSGPRALSAQEHHQAQEPRGITAQDYYRMTFVSDVALSPDGSRVAFTVTRVMEDENRRQRTVWLAELEDGRLLGEPLAFTDPTRDASSPAWSPDGRLLAIQSRRDEGASTWFLRVGAPGGEAFRIDGLEGTPIWSPDGAWIAFTRRTGETEEGPRAGWIAPDAISQTLDRSRFDGRVLTHPRYKSDGTNPLLAHPGTRGTTQLFVIPAQGGEARQVTDLPFDVGGVGWTPDGRRFFFAGNEAADDVWTRSGDLYTVPFEGGEVRRLTPGPGSGAWRAPAISPDGSRLAFLRAPAPNEPTALQVVDLDSDGSFVGAPRTLLDGREQSPGAPRWTADGSSLRFTSSWRGSAHLHEIPATGGALRAVTSGERQVGSVDESRDGRLMAYTSTDAVSPAEVFVARADGEGEARITAFNDEWLQEVTLNPAREITWTVADGTEIQGWVIAPMGHEPGQRYPMILKAHGGPHSMYGHTFFQAFHLLSANGFYVFYPNPRGSSGYPHAFTYATLGGWGLVDEEDFLSGVDAVLARHPDIDPARLGVSGGSYGGYVANWLIGRSDRFAAAVTSRSIASLENLWGISDALGTLEFEFGGVPWEIPDVYRAASPITYVGNVTAPTLIIHSETDHRTPMADGELFFRALQRQGVPAEMVRYPRSSHGLSRTGEPWLLVDRLERIRSWFVHWLGEDGSTASRNR